MNQKTFAFAGDRVAEFRQWLAENPHAYQWIKDKALELKRVGRTHYSIKTLIEHCRHHTAIWTQDPQFKINNNWAPYLARQLMHDAPELRGFFELRAQHVEFKPR